MCLTVIVRAPIAERSALAAAADALPPHTLRVELARAAEASLSLDGGCACSLLADDAGWDAATWAMRPEVREPLARTLEALTRAVRQTAVEAFWAGDGPEREEAVTPAALASLARAGALGTRTRYVVSDAPAS